MVKKSEIWKGVHYLLWYDEPEFLHPVFHEVLLPEVLDHILVGPEDEASGGLTLDGEVHVAYLAVERVPAQIEVAGELLVELPGQHDGVATPRKHLVWKIKKNI